MRIIGSVGFAFLIGVMIHIDQPAVAAAMFTLFVGLLIDDVVMAIRGRF